ncbi:sugar phosphate isomerase/epimerase family protein [Victivallis vadensis]|uniref:sugar phosphate isomerase/epimerase family protein n=1 Tax=Victivallis vadensis TaxID=172901 RepID=UPI00307DB8E6
MKELAIGTMVRFGIPPEESFRRLKSLGLDSCQLATVPDDYLYGQEGRDNTRRLRDKIEEYGIEVTSLFLSFPDQDWKDWRNSIGLVPPRTRAARLVRACRSADWARELGIVQIASHVGCIPEDSASEAFRSFVDDLRPFVRLLGANGQILAYETGQESVAVLKRTMEAVGEENQGVNFDPANLLIYNHDDPAVLLRELGDRVVHLHCKDAVRPAPGEELGRETRFGEGATNFRELLRALYKLGYRGPLTIEREIAPGAELDRDLVQAVELLKTLKEGLNS